MQLKAYFNWLNAGKPEGRDLDFWLSAEKERSTAKIKWGENKGTAQIYSQGVELALCSDDNEQIGTFVLCKDFFQDAIVSYLHDQTCGIYGYVYDPKKMPPIPQKNIKVLIANSGDKDFSDKISNLQDFLHQLEDRVGVSRSVIQKCENPPSKYASGIYLLTGDKKWMIAPPILSLWTLIARNGLVHKSGNKLEDTIDQIINEKIKPGQKNDHIYLKWAKPGLDLILEKGIDALFGQDMKANYPKEHAGHTMHHFSGIVSFGTCKAKPHFPKWLYPATETNPPSICFS